MAKKPPKYIWLITISLAMLLLNALSYNDSWCYWTGIDEEGYFMQRDVAVEYRPANLPGMNILSIDADPNNAGYVAISNSGNLFATADNGNSWTKIPGEGIVHLDAQWVDKKLVVVLSNRLAYSSDLGRTWQSLATSEYGLEFFNMRRGKLGKLWITRSNQDGPFAYYTIESSGNSLSLKAQQRENFEQGAVYKTVIYNSHTDKIPSRYAVATVDGYWAATDAGPYYARKDDVQYNPLTQALSSKSTTQGWHALLNGIMASPISEIIVSTKKPNLIVTWSGGKLWRSEDFGNSWQQVKTAGYVIRAHFLRNGSLLVMFENKQLNIIDDHNTIDISPTDSNFFYKSLDQHIENLAAHDRSLSRFETRKIDKELVRLFGMGDDANQLWLVMGDDTINESPSPVDRGLYQRILNHKKFRNEFIANKITRIGVFTYSATQSWRFQPFQSLQKLENNTHSDCKLSLKGSNLYLNDRLVPDNLIGRGPVRADWLNDNNSLYVLSDWNLEIVPLDHCNINGTITAWGLQKIGLSVYSKVFKTNDGIKIVTPDEEGVDIVDIAFTYPPPWRWLLYHLSFGIVSYIVWGLLVVWMVLLYRSHKVKAA